MITRKRINFNLQEAFFAVEERTINYEEPMKKPIKISGYKALVNKELGAVIAVVSSKYKLLLNEEAYKLADHIIRVIFEGKTLSDFECFNVLMPKSKGSCCIDLILPNKFNELFGNTTESWTPFVRISNSYNKTSLLKYEIGFCRWICKNGVIFDQQGIRFSMNHCGCLDTEINKLIQKARIEIGEIGSLWSQFEKKMIKLKSTPIPISSALAMYCKVFDLKKKKQEESNTNVDILRAKAKQILKASKDYFKELGNNGYAMMNVLTDFASFPEWRSNSAYLVDGYQRKVGLWVDDFLKHSQDKNFSPSKYIGNEYQDMAYYMESLVSLNN